MRTKQSQIGSEHAELAPVSPLSQPAVASSASSRPLNFDFVTRISIDSASNQSLHVQQASSAKPLTLFSPSTPCATQFMLQSLHIHHASSLA